jgi:hypothetical protein
LVLVLAAIASVGCSSHPHAVDATTTPVQCEATFDQAVDKTCSTPSDCALLSHPDCCGDVEIGVAKAGLAAAMTSEATYDSCTASSCGARGCDHAPAAEDGLVPSAGQSIVVTCASMKCSSTVQ